MPVASESTLPTDRNSEPIQVLSPVTSTAVYAGLSATSAQVTIPTTTRIIQISNSQDMWAKFGTGAVTAVKDTAGNLFLVAGERALKVPENSTTVAFVRDSTDGRVCVFNLQ